ADFHTYFVGCDEWGFSVWVHNACALEIVPHEGGFALRNTRTGQLVRAGNSNDVIKLASRQDALNWIFRYGVSEPAYTTVPALNAAAEAEIINALPQYVKGAGGIADNCHGVLAVTIKGETRLYRIGSGGPNIEAGYAQSLAPANAPDLIPAFTPQN